MNGVDIADQLRSYYATHKKSRRIWMPMFFWLLDTSIINSYIIAKTKNTSLSQRQFREQLTWDLIFSTKQISIDEFSPSNVIPYVVKGYEPDHKDFKGNHFGGFKRKRRSCLLCRWKKLKGLQNKVSVSRYFCKGCNANFCINLEKNCHEEYQMNGMK